MRSFLVLMILLIAWALMGFALVMDKNPPLHIDRSVGGLR
jgi:ammonia channel protein AmtB